MVYIPYENIITGERLAKMSITSPAIAEKGQKLNLPTRICAQFVSGPNPTLVTAAIRIHVSLERFILLSSSDEKHGAANKKLSDPFTTAAYPKSSPFT